MAILRKEKPIPTDSNTYRGKTYRDFKSVDVNEILSY